MDFLDVLLQAGLVTGAIVAYLIFFRRSTPSKLKGNYRQPGWNYLFRYLNARYAVRRWKSELPVNYPSELPRVVQHEGWDCIAYRASSPDGAAIYISIRKLCERPALAELAIFIKLPDGNSFTLPSHPDTFVGLWEETSNGWKAGGLKIDILEQKRSARIFYNGPLKRNNDGVIEHVRLNFIWASASKDYRYPEDWSNKLAAQALALEPWRDGDWPSILSKWGNGSWSQWGALQGRLESYNSTGVASCSAYLRVRGVKERCWATKAHRSMRRCMALTASARDGTAVLLQAFSYNDVLTVGFSGCVRFPDYTVESITDTDLSLAEFCEHPDSTPQTYTINVTTNKRTVNVVLRLNNDEGNLLSGVPYKLNTIYRTAIVSIDGEPGAGIVELGYSTNKQGPVVNLPKISLRWAAEAEVKDVGYCAAFAESAAQCTAYVGGKGASLALLAAVQDQIGYRVPPGYCITIKSLDKHLDANPAIMSAIKEIEAANENYDENNFREKCNKVVDLFNSTEIVSEVRDEILLHLKNLREEALEQNLGPEVRVAVRSSAVGEDSEALSAAGQNESVLGCVSEADVLRAVARCWGSMYAFTSVHYRRQNGQQCECGGAVVVQALVCARAAGVMFTAHPARGDQARLLLTANYGLGESVVSGSVEPDTIIVNRGKELTIGQIEVGSKKQRIMAAGDSVVSESVAESERLLPCLSVKEALELARVGVALEVAWGAPRDIEWAVTKDEIFLLQARPITSLERWTEEELLHEFDTPIMADDELITFANTGEVLPKPITALSYDVMVKPLVGAMNSIINAAVDNYDDNVFITHCRGTLNLYNTFYRVPPKQVNVITRILELSISGSKIATDNILAIANRRREFSWRNTVMQIYHTFKFTFTSKWAMTDAVKTTKNLRLRTDLDDPLAILEDIADKNDDIFRVTTDHGITSAGSSATQFVAMLVLIEGGSDFTSEHCHEVNTLLSSGDVLSAQVPQMLANIAKLLNDSGKVEEFRQQDPKKAMDWLRINLPNVYSKVEKFLEEHGHRAIMEFDLATKPWALVPEEMMEVLQNMRMISDEMIRKQPTDQEIIASLKTPKKSSTKKILRWILPLCRHTVRNREITKSNLCMALHKVRLAARRLGKLMVKQWYIPDEDLVFHFRMHELRNFLLTRDPAILRKAMQRKQYHPSWCKLKFAELHTGWVRPLASRPPAVAAADARVRATVVCGGEIVARACVVKDLSEIGQLQRGDILITHSTDIGWSPYFPLLSGIVTELGGLISHGAVIAREYGLPCLVGALDATDIFKTGDTVRLAATEGFLERVQLIENDEANTENN